MFVISSFVPLKMFSVGAESTWKKIRRLPRFIPSRRVKRLIRRSKIDTSVFLILSDLIKHVQKRKCCIYIYIYIYIYLYILLKPFFECAILNKYPSLFNPSKNLFKIIPFFLSRELLSDKTSIVCHLKVITARHYSTARNPNVNDVLINHASPVQALCSLSKFN